jgi:hypothetical protein
MLLSDHRLAFLLFLILLLSACREKKNSIYGYSLLKTGEKVFLLDDDTPPVSLSTAYYENNDKQFYLILNDYRSKYLVYDYQTGDLLTKFTLNRYQNPYGWYFNSFDSIFVCARGLENLIFIADSSGNQKYRKNTESDLYDSTVPEVLCTPTNPVLFRGDTMFYSRIVVGVDPGIAKRSEIVLGGAYNLKTGERYNCIYYPHFMFINYYGFIHYWYNHTCFSERDMIVSFVASEYLYKYSLQDFSSDSVMCCSDFFSGIKPMTGSLRKVSYSQEKSARYYASSPSYYAVFYDKYRKLYYRIAELPNKKREFDKSNPMESVRKRQTIIVLDQNFNKVAETYIGKSYRIANTLITPDGLLLSRRDPDESTITYDIYKLAKND